MRRALATAGVLACIGLALPGSPASARTLTLRPSACAASSCTFSLHALRGQRHRTVGAVLRLGRHRHAVRAGKVRRRIQRGRITFRVRRPAARRRPLLRVRLDTRRPGRPGSVRGVAEAGGTVRLSWDAARDDVGVAGYRVLRRGGHGRLVRAAARGRRARVFVTQGAPRHDLGRGRGRPCRERLAPRPRHRARAGPGGGRPGRRPRPGGAGPGGARRPRVRRASRPTCGCPSATARAGSRPSPTTSRGTCRSASSRPPCRTSGAPTATAGRTRRSAARTRRRRSSASRTASSTTPSTPRPACTSWARRRRSCPTPTPTSGRPTAATPSASAATCCRATRWPGCCGRTVAGWPGDGEIDFPEGDLDGRVCGYVHHQEGTSPGDQDAVCSGESFQGWHTAVIEWTPAYVRFILDGVTLRVTTSRLPTTSMHWVLQTETNLDGRPIADTTAGHVQIDWVAAWRPA